MREALDFYLVENMNRLIFSLYVEVPDNEFVDNVETNLNTKKEMNDNYQKLVDCKQQYADSIGVDFVIPTSLKNTMMK